MPTDPEPKKVVYVCRERRGGAKCAGTHDRPGRCAECGGELVAREARRVRD